jgi:hypothetical protein
MNSFDTALDALREILAARASGPAMPRMSVLWILGSHLA